MARYSKQQILAAFGVVLTTLIWGGGFVVTKDAIGLIPPIYLMAVRFTAAGAALTVIFFKRIVKIKKPDLKPGVILGCWLAASYIAQTYGIKYTTASNSAFITTTYVVAVPFLNLLMYKIRIRAAHIAAAVTALFGVALLSVDGTFGVNSGDALTLLCGMCFAVHIVLLGRYTAERGVIALTALQLFAAAAVCWASALLFEGAFDVSAFAGESGPRLLAEIIYLALLSTMLGFLFQTSAQKHLPTVTVSVLLTLECVFGALFSVLFLNDPLSARILAGFALMFLAVLIAVLRSASD